MNELTTPEQCFQLFRIQLFAIGCRVCAGCGHRYDYSRRSGHGFKFCRHCLASIPVCAFCGKPPSIATVYTWMRAPVHGPYACRSCRTERNMWRSRGRCSRCGRKVYRDETSSKEIVCRTCRQDRPEFRVDPGEQHQRQLDRARERKRRIRGAGEPWDGVRDEAIYERDSWECQIPACLCPSGRRITEDKGGRGKKAGPWSATIDHIVPLSIGGGDTAANKRAAHRKCNGARRPDASAWRSC